MFYHAKANGQIVVTDEQIESGDSGIDWSSVSDETMLVINCPDEETAKDGLRQFKQAILESQLSGEA